MLKIFVFIFFSFGLIFFKKNVIRPDTGPMLSCGDVTLAF